MSDRTAALGSGMKRQRADPTPQRRRRARTILASPVVGALIGFIVIGALVGRLPPGRYAAVTLVVVYSVVGISQVVLFGVAGKISLGHALFVAVGALLAARISADTPFGLEIEILVAATAGLGLGLVLGLPSLRVDGLFLAVATFAVGIAGTEALYQWKDFSGGGSGQRTGKLFIFGTRFNGRLAVLYAALCVLVVVCAVAHNLLRGKTGRSLHALRTSDSAARAIGIPVRRRQLLAFAVSGAIATIGGVLYAHTIGFINVQTFDSQLSILFLLTIVIGGQRFLLGAIIGSTFFIGLPEFMRSIQQWEGALVGTALLIVVLVLPEGLVGGFQVLTRRSAHTDRTPRPPIIAAAPASVTSNEDRSPALEVEHIRVVFGGVVAVEDVSFSVPRGDVLGLIGPNGAGKTTAFNAISGAVQASGIVRVKGVDISDRSVAKRSLAGIGRSFQNLNLHGDRTVLDHAKIGMDRFAHYNGLSEVLRTPKVRRIERLLDEAAMHLLDELDLAQHALLVADQLPYGLQKRVDIARALATQPSVLLLDEPAAGLVEEEAHELIDRVLTIARQSQMTVVMIDHNVELVATSCHDIVVMDTGSVIAQGDAEYILHHEQAISAYIGGDPGDD